jgi:hypothetical protein
MLLNSALLLPEKSAESKDNRAAVSRAFDDNISRERPQSRRRREACPQGAGPDAPPPNPGGIILETGRIALEILSLHYANASKCSGRK